MTLSIYSATLSTTQKKSIKSNKKKYILRTKYKILHIFQDKEKIIKIIIIIPF